MCSLRCFPEHRTKLTSILQGCESDPETGFRYLQQAAESVVQNLDRVISGHIQLSEQQMEEQSAKVRSLSQNWCGNTS